MYKQKLRELKEKIENLTVTVGEYGKNYFKNPKQLMDLLKKPQGQFRNTVTRK